jgi:hypothetical protein
MIEYVSKIMTTNRYAIACEIAQLDPQADNQRIMYLLSAHEHPWLMRKALEFALFRTYAVPSISRLLQATNQFQQHGQKRYDDTSLLLSTLIEQGYESAYGAAAIARMNHWHERYRIKNDDFRYVLSVFVYEPVRWINRFGWRALSRNEQAAMYYFWWEVGQRMGIKEIPPAYDAFEAFNCAYERQYFGYANSNYAIGEATVQIFLQWYPVWLRPAVRRGIYALLDEPLRQAFGFPQTPAWLCRFVSLGLKVALAGQRLLPPRRKPYHFTQVANRTYPSGYTLATLGPTQSTAVPETDQQKV